MPDEQGGIDIYPARLVSVAAEFTANEGGIYPTEGRVAGEGRLIQGRQVIASAKCELPPTLRTM